MTLTFRSAVPLLLFAGQPLLLMAQAKPTAQPYFTSVTVRPNTSPQIRWRAMFTKDGVSAEDTTLGYLLRMAYGFEPQQQWAAVPAWVEQTRFDVEARIASAAVPNPTEDQRREALQGLLAKQFGLRLHHENRAYPIEMLSIAQSGGPTQSRPEEIHHNREDAAPICVFTHSQPGHVRMEGCTMADLAMRLSAKGDGAGIVLDRTGLAGRYTMELRWTPQTSAEVARVAADGDGQQSAPELAPAVREQLGLQLVPGRADLDTIVVDQVQMTPKE